MWNTLRRLIVANPMGIFVYTILTKWYLTMAIAGLVVAFWVLKGLAQAGVLQAAEKIVSEALSDSKSVAKYCVPKITNIADFWSCLNNPPQYEADQNEQILQKTLEKAIPNNAYSPQDNNPYDNRADQ